MEEPAKEFDRSPIEVNATEAIIVEPISMMPPVETEVLEVGKKSKPTLIVELAIIDTEKSEQPKKEPTKESSDASVIIQ